MDGGESLICHDVAYSLTGNRIATCDSRRRITVYIRGADGSWQRQSQFSAHLGPVWRVTWAHPEFGAIIASCSFDRNVLIWEEQEGVDDKGRIVSRWHQRAQLSDARDSVNEIKFAPRHMGLKIAAGSADGHVRVYEATDATSLAHWDFHEEFEAEPAASGGVACLAWTTSPFDTAMMVVGGGSGMAKVWAYSPAARRWLAMLELKGHSGRVQDVAWAPNVGRSYHLIATCGAEGAVAVWRLQPDAAADYVPAAAAAAAAGSPSMVGLTSPASSSSSVWAVKKLPGSSAEALVAAVFEDHGGMPVWRVEWNVTGTVLASSGDDGFLRLRKQAAVGSREWVTTASLEMASQSSQQQQQQQQQQSQAQPSPSPSHHSALPTPSQQPPASMMMTSMMMRGGGGAGTGMGVPPEALYGFSGGFGGSGRGDVTSGLAWGLPGSF